MPLKTRVYTLLLVLTTAVAAVIVFRRDYQISVTNLPFTACILFVMILIAELLEVSFPQGGQTFAVSVSAAFCFAAGLTAGPLLGGLVGALAYGIDGIIARRQPIKTLVNSAGMALSTIVSGAVYLELAEPGPSTIGSYKNLLAAVLAAAIYTLINSGSLALIVAPVMGVGPIQMWRINTAGLHVELLTV